MFTIIEIFKANKKILVEIAACKLVEGFFILLGASFLVKFIDSPSEKFLMATLGFFAGRFLISSRAEIIFARLSANVQTSFRKKIHAQIFDKEIASGELLTLIFDTVQSLDEFFMKVAPQVASFPTDIFNLRGGRRLDNGGDFAFDVADSSAVAVADWKGDGGKICAGVG